MLSVFANLNDVNRKTKFDHLFDKDKRVVHLLNIYWINLRRDVRDTRLRKETLILVEEQEPSPLILPPRPPWRGLHSLFRGHI